MQGSVDDMLARDQAQQQQELELIEKQIQALRAIQQQQPPPPQPEGLLSQMMQPSPPPPQPAPVAPQPVRSPASPVGSDGKPKRKSLWTVMRESTKEVCCVFPLNTSMYNSIQHLGFVW